ncbi:DUF7860 family protein [Halalkalicoccus jeotgali]|uniref:Uncharacterized protein n=1 Tax=Halalkalicoccus jeotgali (strain DSM 18796 / CECT 7217 / JCM 14584 / KCTC 4019 / B3) TaxID=795797 RepID=D8J2M0_HALJB|nr:hypothetical protein [Halalkalicoccus jeotgali]ADJ14977.1 hypothetical protein HacjB3_07960 [Halalkalicoccus jeotgali B3]ELY35007.1 hypothetical protein C497_14762 [Halalkalicoccus jeotgali B3]
MGQHQRLSYSQYARGGFALGVAVFLVGILGHAVGPALLGALPAWEVTLFTVMEFSGIGLALCSPLVFAIVLPLIE